MLRATVTRRIQTAYGGLHLKPHDTPHGGGHHPPTPQGSFFTNYFGQGTLRSFKNTYFPDVGTADMSAQGSYLLSGIQYDLQKLSEVDWTAEFDSFWADQVKGHEKMYDILYTDQGGRLYKFLVGDRRGAQFEAERKTILRDLNILRATLKWAQRTERCFTAIAQTRFTMQREVWCPIERERLLLGCAEAYVAFTQEVPAQFEKKATKELQWHLTTMRHWVWDCPNAKRVYSRLLA